MRSLNTDGTGAWQSYGARDTINRDYGSHALFDMGKILVAGGGASTRDARVIDINGATPAGHRRPRRWPFGRRQHNLTVLADGTRARDRRQLVRRRPRRPQQRRLRRPSAGIRRPARGRRSRPSRSPASTTRPRCCSPTDACCPRAAGSAAPAIGRLPRQERAGLHAAVPVQDRRVGPARRRARDRRRARRWRPTGAASRSTRPGRRRSARSHSSGSAPSRTR